RLAADPSRRLAPTRLPALPRVERLSLVTAAAEGRLLQLVAAAAAAATTAATGRHDQQDDDRRNDQRDEQPDPRVAERVHDTGLPRIAASSRESARRDSSIGAGECTSGVCRS